MLADPEKQAQRGGIHQGALSKVVKRDRFIDTVGIRQITGSEDDCWYTGRYQKARGRRTAHRSNTGLSTAHDANGFPCDAHNLTLRVYFRRLQTCSLDHLNTNFPPLSERRSQRGLFDPSRVLPLPRARNDNRS